MNIYLYSKNTRCRVYWPSSSDDFVVLFSKLKQEESIHTVTGSFVLLTANERTRNCISEYCRENDSASRFNCRKIAAFVSKLKADECFYILDGDSVNDYERLAAIEVLNTANDLYRQPYFLQEVQRVLNTYAEVRSKYNLYSYGIDESPVYVGEPDKNKRVCRFCRESGMAYKDVAHAIPEALGNTKLFCNEECDVCNHKLNVIEDNFIALMDVRRAIFRIKRKGTSDVPNIDGQNFVIRDNGDGKPVIYYMEEALPKRWQEMDVIPVRLNLKYKTTNENIYKALCKMAVDLMPSQFVGQFSETIDWISSDGKFIPDNLPSCYMGLLPDGVFYEQPQLHLFVKKDVELEAPFCFAILNIYDICYRFVVPFSKPDAGRYRTDDSLISFWSRFHTEPALTWYKQDTSDWWYSAPWAEFDIAKNAPFFVIRPTADPIFENCREIENFGVLYYKEFNVDDLVIHIDHLICKCYSKDTISQELLRDTSVEFTSPLYSFYEDEQLLQLKFSMSAKVADREKPFLSIVVEASVPLEKFSDQINYDHWTVNGDFTHAVWDKLSAEVARRVSIRLKYTQFSRLNPLKEFNSQNHRFMRETLYDFYTVAGHYVRMPYVCLHEEMSESKRGKLFRKANGISEK